MNILLDIIAFLIRWTFTAGVGICAVVFIIHFWQVFVFLAACFLLVALIGWAFER